MRVVFLNPSGALGGAERCLLDLIASLRETAPGIDLRLVASADGPLVADAASLGVGVSVLSMPDALSEVGDSGMSDGGRLAALGALARTAPKKALALKRYITRLDDELAALQPTVVHSNGIKFHILTGLLGRARWPLVWHIRDMLGARPLVAKALRAVSGRASAAIAVSDLVARDARMVLASTPIHVVYDAIDTDAFSPAEGDGAWLDALAGMPAAPAGTCRVGLVAAFGRWKGQDLFLDAISRLAAEGRAESARFYVVGGPIYQTHGSQFTKEELRATAARLGIAERVAFVDFQDDVVRIFQALDVVVHASTRPEPFGRTIAEAMACSKALVLSRSSGAAELLGEEKAAVDFATGDPAALAAAIGGLIEDQTLRRRFADGARRIAVERFSRDRLGPDVLDVYARVTGERPPVTDARTAGDRALP